MRYLKEELHDILWRCVPINWLLLEIGCLLSFAEIDVNENETRKWYIWILNEYNKLGLIQIRIKLRGCYSKIHIYCYQVRNEGSNNWKHQICTNIHVKMKRLVVECQYHKFSRLKSDYIKYNFGTKAKNHNTKHSSLDSIYKLR